MRKLTVDSDALVDLTNVENLGKAYEVSLKGDGASSEVKLGNIGDKDADHDISY